MSVTRGASQIYCTLPTDVRSSVQDALDDLFATVPGFISAPISTVVDDNFYNAFPGCCTAADGTIVVVYYKGTLHISSPSSLYSRRGTLNADGSITWGAEVLIYSSGTANISTRGVNVMRMANGYLLASGWYYNTGTAESTGFGSVFISTDSGLTWGAPITVGGCTGYVNIQGRAIQLETGRLLLPVFGQDSPSGLLAARLQYSDDNGATWATLSTMLTGSNSIEVSIVQVANGTIVATFRDQALNEIGVSTSTDDGVTWSAYVSKFAGASPAPMIERLDGAILTSYRSWTDPLYSQMALRVSYDDGASWTSPEYSIISASAPGFEYSDFCQLDNGIGMVWCAQESTTSSNCYFTILPNNFGTVPITQSAQGFVSKNGDVVLQGGNVSFAAVSNSTAKIWMPGVTTALGTSGIEIFPHAKSAAFGAGLGAYAAANPTYPGVSFAGTSTGGWFGVYDTCDPSGNPRFRVFNANHAILGPGTANPLGVTNEFTVRAPNSSNQVAFNAQGWVIVDGSSPAFYAIWNNGVRTMTISAQRNGGDSAADFIVSLNNGSSTNERLKVDKNGNVGLGGNTTNLVGLTKEATVSATSAGNQVGINLQGNITSGTNSPGLLSFYNNGTRTAAITAPREGADGNAGMEFYVSDGGLQVGLSLAKTGAATFRTNVRLTPQVFSQLPAAAAGNAGTQAVVTDSTTVVWGATITGGGANTVLAFSNGTNWTVAAK